MHIRITIWGTCTESEGIELAAWMAGRLNAKIELLDAHKRTVTADLLLPRKRPGEKILAQASKAIDPSDLTRMRLQIDLLD